jgi:farnesyl-diphosphate farnesyltransferase
LAALRNAKKLLSETINDIAPTSGSSAGQSAESEFQRTMLEGVSRTFALTIPQLPGDLTTVVSNGYLLCRIMDTIEDEPALTPTQKRDFSARFVGAVAGRDPVERFSAELAPLLSAATIPAEHALIRETPRVLEITHRFTPSQQAALATCVRVMGEGMVRFQENRQLGQARGLEDLAELDRYCYHVAGVVGEMLTRLFCEYSPAIAAQRDRLMPLAVSFGQGLQMTNILKDIWADLGRGACWLPREVFARAGFDLKDLSPQGYNASFRDGLRTLVAIANGHLRNAVRYTLRMPVHETGIRNFCLWAIGMAILTLRKIHRHPDFTDGDQVKISRLSVKATVITSRVVAGQDNAIAFLARAAALGLPLMHTEVR